MLHLHVTPTSTLPHIFLWRLSGLPPDLDQRLQSGETAHGLFGANKAIMDCSEPVVDTGQFDLGVWHDQVALSKRCLRIVCAGCLIRPMR